jgi:hypothetical protein
MLKMFLFISLVSFSLCFFGIRVKYNQAPVDDLRRSVEHLVPSALIRIDEIIKHFVSKLDEYKETTMEEALLFRQQLNQLLIDFHAGNQINIDHFFNSAFVNLDNFFDKYINPIVNKTILTILFTFVIIFFTAALFSTNRTILLTLSFLLVSILPFFIWFTLGSPKLTEIDNMTHKIINDFNDKKKELESIIEKLNYEIKIKKEDLNLHLENISSSLNSQIIELRNTFDRYIPVENPADIIEIRTEVFRSEYGHLPRMDWYCPPGYYVSGITIISDRRALPFPRCTKFRGS